MPLLMLAYYVAIREAHDLGRAFVVVPLVSRGHYWRNELIFILTWTLTDVVLALALCRPVAWAFGRSAGVAAFLLAAPWTLRLAYDIFDSGISFATGRSAFIAVSVLLHVVASFAFLVWLTDRARRSPPSRPPDLR